MATFQLDIVTPERLVVSEQVRGVRAPGIDGSLGVLAGHAPLMTALGLGFVKVTFENGDVEHIATDGGFMEVTPERVVILADTAERAEDVDVARAEAAIAKARAAISSGEVADYDEARRALERATNRLRLTQMQNTDTP